MRVSSLCWGVVFVGIGLFFLAINTGYLSHYVWIKLASLWPVILIAAGIALIFSRTKLKYLALLAPIILGATFYYVAATEWNGGKFPGSSYSYSASYAREVFEYQVDPDPEVTSLDIEIDFGLGEMWLGSTSNVLFDGDFEYRTRKPDIRYSVDDGEGEIRVKSRDLERLNVFKRRIFKNDSRIFIADYVPISLDLDIGAAKVDLDMEEHKLERLKLDTGAAEIDLRIGCNTEKMMIDIDSGASSINIYVPRELGIEIDSDIAISSTNFRSAGLEKYRGKYRSDNLRSADCTAKFNIDSGVSEIKIRYY